MNKHNGCFIKSCLITSALAFLGISAAFIYFVFIFDLWEIKPSSYTFYEKRMQHVTELTYRGNAPQTGSHDEPPEGVSIIQYQSEGLILNAWYAIPKSTNPENDPIPAVVYFHGGFAFGGTGSLSVVQPFIDAGYAVLLPILRAENDQDGHYELMYGEVLDALAAVQWLSKQPKIDTTRIFTFGHSVGANISAMLTLFPDSPVRVASGAGGLYFEEVFYDWEDFSPFDIENTLERELRIFTPHIDDMLLPYVAYIGEEDTLKRAALSAQKLAKKLDKPLTVNFIHGDHFDTLEPAVQLFLEHINQIQ